MIKLPIGLTRTFGKVALWTKRHLPEILTYGGVATTVGGTALMCRATLKADKALTEAHEQDTKEAKRKARVEVVKQFAPAIAVEGAGIGMILGGHHVLRKENLMLAASNAAMAAAFAKYRKKVRAEMDELKEQRCFAEAQGLISEEEGHEEAEDCGAGIYMAIFDELNPNWSKNPEDNIWFLHNAERMLTQRLHAKGYMFLNEILDDLGCRLTQPGQYVGKVDSGYMGTSYISLGLPSDEEMRRSFSLGEGILLNIDVDGDIMYILGGKRVREIQEEA